MHNDGTYLSCAPGVQVLSVNKAKRLCLCYSQVFHFSKSASEGGETLLSDGFQGAAELGTINPAAYDILRSVPIPHEFRDGRGTHLATNRPVIVENADAELEQVQ